MKLEEKKGEDVKVEGKGEDVKNEAKKGEKGERELVVPTHRRRMKSFRP